jgi:hypothetical protein
MEQTSDSAPSSDAERRHSPRQSTSRPPGPAVTPAADARPGHRRRGVSWRAVAPEAACVALLALVAVVFFWPVVSGRAWLPRGGGDSVSFLFPMYRFAADSLRDGVIPFWNPHQYAGAPFLADNQSGLFYPFNLLLFLLRPGFGYGGIQALVVWHFFLAGAAMYACLRLLRPEISLGRPAALLGALAFMLSDVFITHIGNLNLVAVAAWLPLAFLGLHRAIFAARPLRRVGWAAAGGAVLGVATLAGHGQMTFLSALFLGSYALYQTVATRRGWALPLLALLGAVAVALAAISLFPAAGTLSQTLRAEFDYARSTNYALPPQALLGLFAPDFYGRGAAFWGDWLRVEVGYAGVLTWFLAAAAVVLRPRRQTLFFVLAGLLFLLLALGPATPLYPALARLLPVIPFQVPARFVLLLGFCLAVLAALGLGALLERRPWPVGPARALLGGTAVAALVVLAALLLARARLAPSQPEHVAQMTRATFVFGGLAVAGWLLLAGGLSRRLPVAALVALALALLFGDLYGLGRYVEIDWNDPTPGFAAGTPGLAFLHADPGLHRLDIATGAWQPNMPMIERLYAARGVYNPLELANYNVYMGAVGFRGSAQYNVLGVKYVIGGKNDPPGDTNFIVPVFDADPNVTIYLNTLALPRAMVLFNTEVVRDHDDAFAATHSAAFDPARVVVLESGVALAQEPGQATLEVNRYEPNRAAFTVTTDRPAYFFLSDTYHPDWQATVDGQPASISVANYAFRGVYVPEGRHEIAMRFVPSGWVAGVVTTAAALIILFTLALIIVRTNGHAGLPSRPAALDSLEERT